MNQSMISLLDGHLSERCAKVIRSGELVIFPTETIYGIGGAAFNDVIWQRLNRLKPDRQKPYTYLAANWEMAEKLIGGDIARIRAIADKVWPGPVTLVVTANVGLEKRFLAENGSIGIRVPGVDRIRHAIETCAIPWVHTSANVSGAKGVRNPRELDPAVRSSAGLIIDGRTTALGGESSVIDMRQIPFRILRQGIMPESLIRELIIR
jgi:L-threonylcarbamoyladenylate synthase